MPRTRGWRPSTARLPRQGTTLALGTCCASRALPRTEAAGRLAGLGFGNLRLLCHGHHVAEADRDQPQGLLGKVELDADFRPLLPHAGAGHGAAVGMAERDSFAGGGGRLRVEQQPRAAEGYVGDPAGQQAPADTDAEREIPIRVIARPFTAIVGL